MTTRHTILTLLATKIQVISASYFLDEIDGLERDKQTAEAIAYYNDMIDKQEEQLRQETITL